MLRLHDPECLDTEATIDEAWRQLGERGYRHIPVVAGDDFKGIVSMRDLVTLAQLRPAGEPALVAPPGLKGVVVAETALGDVRGQEGFYHYRQYDATDLAPTDDLDETDLANNAATIEVLIPSSPPAPGQVIQPC